MLQVDNTKRMYIEQILRKTQMFDEVDIFDEMLEASMKPASEELKT